MDSATLADKVGDPEFMQSFTMNKRPLLVLLERGFLQRSLEDEVPPKYIKFLTQMLHRPFEETGTVRYHRINVAPSTLLSRVSTLLACRK